MKTFASLVILAVVVAVTAVIFWSVVGYGFGLGFCLAAGALC